MIRLILLDIEGTTTDIHFVHNVLFPYSAHHLPSFIQGYYSSQPAIQQAIADVIQTVQTEQGVQISVQQAIEELLHWIEVDRKHPALKLLQGLVWRDGYKTFAYRGHVYGDVKRALQKWEVEGIELGIYSSGSVEAQKLLFEYSTDGDLTRYLKYHFDTAVGGKREVESYRHIAEQVGLPPLEILFLSDIPEELDAARLAGLRTLQVVREGTEPYPRHEQVPNLLAINLPETPKKMERP